MARRVPLAWKNLTHSLPKLAVALSGVAFAVVLMFMQTGFRNALFDSTVQPIEELNADIIIVSNARYSLSRSSRFPLDQLLAARAVEGVASVHPLYIEMLAAVFRTGNRRGRPIRVLGIDTHRSPLRNREVQQQLSKLRQPQAALMDRRTKPVFGLSWKLAEKGVVQTGELANQQISIVGAFDLAADFANEGTLVISKENFADYFPTRAGGRPLSIVDVGLVNVAPGADVAAVRRALLEQMPSELSVFTREAFRTREIQFWAQSTPIGIIFGIGTIMGFVVGVIMCYQVIYTDISDHMAEFATLKAMGYPPKFFANLVITQSVYLSLIGFIPGFLLSWLLFAVIASSTGLLMQMTLLRALLILLLTLAMCVISGGIALRRLLTADPASLF